jgi:general secretion pathway protein F
VLAPWIAEFWKAKFQRSLDNLVESPIARRSSRTNIIVGGLIVSVMTALMSVSQAAG